MRRALAVVSVLAISLSCIDSPDPSAPQSPDLAVLDGEHGGPAGFYFLPPIVPSPEYSGTFNPSLRPTVNVWGPFNLAGDPPDVVNGFCRNPDEAGAVVTFPNIVPVDEVYHAGWQTGASGLQNERGYRICVWQQTAQSGTLQWVLLGYRDVKPEATNQDNRSTDQNPVWEFNNGSNVPIKFRIEIGALGCFQYLSDNVEDCTELFLAQGQGGTGICADNTCAIQVPDNALQNDAFFIVRRLECNESTAIHPHFLDRAGDPDDDLALPQFPGCLLIESNAQLNQTMIVAACITKTVDDGSGNFVPTPALNKLTDQQSGELIDDLVARVQLHHLRDDGQLEALPNASSPIDGNCEELFHTAMLPSGLKGVLARGLRLAQRTFLPFIDPPNALAVNRGFGGHTELKSPFVWAMPAQAQKLQPLAAIAGSTGQEVLIDIATTNNVSDDCTDNVTNGCRVFGDAGVVGVPGARVWLEVTQGDGSVKSPEDACSEIGGCLGIAGARTKMVVRTGTDGTLPEVYWKLGSPGIPHEVQAYGFGLGLLTGVKDAESNRLGSGPYAKHTFTSTPADGIVLLEDEPLRLSFTAAVCSDKSGILETAAIDADYGTPTTIPINVSGTTASTASLYWTTDCDHIYFAFKVPGAPDLQNSLRFVFVDRLENGGTAWNPQNPTATFAAVPELNDDMWKVSRNKAGGFDLEDLHIANDCTGNLKQSECGALDAVQSLKKGTTVGPVYQVTENGSIATVYEFARCFPGGTTPCTADPQDFYVPAVGQSTWVGFYLVLQQKTARGSQGNTEYPGFRVFQPIEIERK